MYRSVSTGRGQGLFLILAAILVILIDQRISSADDNNTQPVKVIGESRFFKSLTPAEKKWVADHPVLRVAGPKAFPPFHYFEATGGAKGMAADYIQFIADQIGFKIETPARLPWPHVLEKAKIHEIDIVSCIAKTADRENYLTFTDPFLSFPLVIISRNDAPFIGGLDDLHGKRIACIRKVMTYDWLMNDHTGIIPHFVDSPLEALESVSLGLADAHIGNLAASSYLIDKNGLFNLKIAAPTTYGNYQLYMAVRNDWPVLTAILNKVFAALDPEEHAGIRNKWLSVRYEHGIRILDVIKWVGLIIAFILPVFIVIIVWNKRLTREIDIRKKLEEALRRINALKEKLITTDNINNRLDLISDSVVEIFHADFARIWILQKADQCHDQCIHKTSLDESHACRHTNQCLHLISSSGRYTRTDGSHQKVPVAYHKLDTIATMETSKFVTNNVTTDPHIHNHQWAMELGLTSFAGYRLLSREGTPVGVLTVFSRHIISEDEDSLLEGIANTTAQIIQVDRAESALDQERDHMTRMIQSSPILIFGIDPSGLTTFVNPACKQVTGYAPRELIGQNWWHMLYDDQQGNPVENIVDSFLNGDVKEYEMVLIHKDGQPRTVVWDSVNRYDENNNLVEIVGFGNDITIRKQEEREREKLINELQDALARIKTLSGLLPICSSCKKIRDDTGYWNQIEAYISIHSDAEFTHGICPECAKKLYPDLDLYPH